MGTRTEQQSLGRAFPTHFFRDEGNEDPFLETVIDHEARVREYARMRARGKRLFEAKPRFRITHKKNKTPNRRNARTCHH